MDDVTTQRSTAVVELVDQYTRNGLVKKCETRGLSTAGTKEELAARIVEHDTQSDEISSLDVSEYRDAELPTSAHVHRTKLNFNDVKDAVNPFAGRGESITTWVHEFEEQCAVFGWSELHKLVYAKRLLEGPARAFIRGIPSISNWKTLKANLLEEFDETEPSASIHELLRRRKQKHEESLLEYVYAMTEIGKRGKVDEASLCEYVAKEIDDDPRNKACLFQARTLKELKLQLKSYERLHEESKRGKNTSQTPRTRKERNSAERSGGKFEGCFNCGGKGHQARNCTKAKVGPKCFRCNEHGHIAKHCEETMKNNANAKRVYTHIEATLLREDALRTIPVKGGQRKNSSVRLYGLGEKQVASSGEILLRADVYGEECDINFTIVPVSPISTQVLLGMDFLATKKFSITNEGVKIVGFRNDEMSNHEEDEAMTKKWINKIEILSNELDVPKAHCEKVSEAIRAYNPGDIKVQGDVSSEMSIHLIDDKPVRACPRRLAPLERDIVRWQVQEWMKDGIVRISNSPFASAVVVVPKKDGSRRVCIDYRELNKKVVRDSYPMPIVEDQIDKLVDARVYSTLDLKNSYFHVVIAEESRKLTSFVTQEGQFEFCRAPFGLCTSGSAFGRFINSALRELINEGVILTFVDDIIIPSKDEEQGMKYLSRLLSVAQRIGLNFNWKKCTFLKRRMEYLGYEIYEGKIEPARNKVERVREFPAPANRKQMQRFYGLVSYFRKFIPRFAETTRTLSMLLKKDAAFNINEEVLRAFHDVKATLSEYPVLRIFKPGLEAEVHTDASKEALAGILMQRAVDDEQFHPNYYFSRLTTGVAKNYHSFELEALAVVETVKKFRCYLLGQRFKIVTDCSAFKQTLAKKKPDAIALAEFDYEVEHRPAERMRHVDALSRVSVMAISSLVSRRVAAAQGEDRDIMKLLEREEIIRNAHEQGHFGVKKTKELIASDYYIPGLEEKIVRCIENCVKCILGEKKRGRKEGKLHPIPKGEVPLETFHIDHLGPMPSSRKSYSYIFTVVDAFSKFIWIFANKMTNAEETVRNLNIIAQTFGYPIRIICDQGAAFTSNLFERFSIVHFLIVTGVPRGNGQAEIIHKTIIPLLTKLSMDKPYEWYKHVNRVQVLMNASRQKAVKTTPFELLVGVKIRRKDDLDEEVQNEFMAQRDGLRKTARDNIAKLQEENKKYYNLRRCEARPFKIGDFIALPVTQFGVERKVKQKFYGPYEIIKIMDNDRYEVRKVDEEKEGPQRMTTSADMIKPWSQSGRL
uniref:RNA-directed DNA polymerase n=1 Tax=Anopheles atroparvus TaxID=41427 RepID=A0AAG5DSK9_ANOAO